jgi:O-antigen ligase
LLLNRREYSFNPAHLSLLLVGLMWVFPFLDYYHAYPLTTFYQEWGAAVLGVAAMPLLAMGGYRRQAEIPRVVLLPIAMMALVLVQFALGRIPYFGQMLLYALYLIWAGLLIMLGGRLRDELGLPAVATVLAIFLLAGAELSAAIGVLQHFHWHTFLDRWVTRKISAAVFGNVAQPNHYADYLTLGLASLGLLFARGSLRPWQAILLGLPILFILPLSGSREIWLYLSWMVIASFFLRRSNESINPLLKYSLASLLGFGLMHLVIQLPWLAGDSGSSINSVQRLFSGNAGSGGIRLQLWHEAWLIFVRFPVLGAGFGQFAWQHFQLLPSLHDTQVTGLYNNAHNLLMQLAAETGLTGLLLFFATLLPWLRQAVRAEHSIYHWWGYIVLGVLGIHSMLEYPLWYAYFIGIAALLLGLLDGTGYRLELHGIGRMTLLAILAAGLLSLQQLLAGYRIFEHMAVLRPQSANAAAYFDKVHADLAAMRRQLLLQPYADLFAGAMIQTGPEHLADKLALNSKAMHFVPIETVVYRQALLLAQNGDIAKAQAQMERAIWSYPGGFADTEQELRELARKDPAHFSALLEFALRKNEEYQRELHALPAK